MKYLFFILALQTLFFSTQPIWQAVCEQWFMDCCPAFFEESNTCTASAACSMPLENGDCDPEEVPQCCPPFQCCFISFMGFSTPYSLEMTDPLAERTKPQAFIKTLRSAYISECFHPPETKVCP